MSSAIYGAIEAGGTKFICAISRDPEQQELLTETRIATTTPEQTLAQVLAFFQQAQRQHGLIDAFGIGTFGPVDLRPESNHYGQILATPKAGWRGADLLKPLRTHFQRPIAIDTDVNAAALAELHFSQSAGIRSLTYITVGTGIGGGAVNNGQTITGALHPEMGHLLVRRHRHDATFAGSCPFHGDCLEGLASGPAIQQRWGAPLSELDDHHEAYEIIGYYLGQLAATINLVLSSERIVFGGGVMQNGKLLPYIRRNAQALLRDYPGSETLTERITTPVLDGRSGLLGALLLAAAASK